MIDTFGRGCHGFELWPGLDVAAEDLIVDKTRFGAFVPGSSELHEILQARGIDTLIITGTATNVCCESTARDAMQMNYKVIFVADGNATNADVEHNATLNNMAALFADVMTTEELVRFLESSGSSRLAAQ
jgi:ureidoacrylate peracid hydrolase